MLEPATICELSGSKPRWRTARGRRSHSAAAAKVLRKETYTVREHANHFSYDAMLRRTAVEDSAGVRYFTWDTNGMNLLAERDATGTVVAGYTHGHAPVPGIGSCVGQKLVQSGETYYEFDICDHRGSVVRRVNAAGQVTGYFEYDAWGSALRAEESGASSRFRYQSNWIELADDPDGVLYLSPTRVYHAGVGRFLGRDGRDGLAGGQTYGTEQPVSAVDPTGLMRWWSPEDCNDRPYAARLLTEDDRKRCLAFEQEDRPHALRQALLDYFSSDPRNVPTIYPMFQYWKRNCECICGNYAKWAELMTWKFDVIGGYYAERARREKFDYTPLPPEFWKKYYNWKTGLNPLFVQAMELIGPEHLQQMQTVAEYTSIFLGAIVILPALGSTYAAAYVGPKAWAFLKSTAPAWRQMYEFYIKGGLRTTGPLVKSVAAGAFKWCLSNPAACTILAKETVDFSLNITGIDPLPPTGPGSFWGALIREAMITTKERMDEEEEQRRRLNKMREETGLMEPIR